MGNRCTVESEKLVELPGFEKPFEQSYTLGKKIAEKVLHVKHNLTGQPRVVYRLKKSLHACQDGEELSQRIKTLMAFDHPSTCRLFDAFDSGAQTMLVYTLVEGKPMTMYLASITDAAKLENQVLSIFLQIFRALAVSLEASISHGAFSSKNVLVNTSGKICVTDIGLAGWLKPLPAISCSKSEEMMYMAPEVVRKWLDNKNHKKQEQQQDPETKAKEERERLAALVQATVNEAADVWSCGVLLHVMVLGRAPCDESKLNTLAENIKDFVFKSKSLPSTSQLVAELLQSMLVKDPGKRPSFQALSQQQCFSSESQKLRLALPKGLGKQLATYHSETHVKKIMMRVVASKIPIRKLGKLKDSFNQLDLDGDGHISLQEFKESLSKDASVKPYIKDLEESFHEIDFHATGTISLDEFIAACIDSEAKLVQTVLWDAYKAVDVDGDGAITMEELEQLIRTLDSSCEEEHIERLLHFFEEEVKEDLSFEAFKHIVMNEGARSDEVKTLKEAFKQEGLSPCARIQRQCRQITQIDCRTPVGASRTSSIRFQEPGKSSSSPGSPLSEPGSPVSEPGSPVSEPGSPFSKSDALPKAKTKGKSKKSQKKA